MNYFRVILYLSVPVLIFLLHQYSLALTVVLLCVSFLLVQTRIQMKLFLVMCVLGYVFEIILGGRAWIYPYPDVVNIPYWIGLVWGIGSLAVINVYNWLLYGRK